MFKNVFHVFLLSVVQPAGRRAGEAIGIILSGVILLGWQGWLVRTANPKPKATARTASWWGPTPEQESARGWWAPARKDHRAPLRRWWWPFGKRKPEPVQSESLDASDLLMMGTLTVGGWVLIALLFVALGCSGTETSLPQGDPDTDAAEREAPEEDAPDCDPPEFEPTICDFPDGDPDELADDPEDEAHDPDTEPDAPACTAHPECAVNPRLENGLCVATPIREREPCGETGLCQQGECRFDSASDEDRELAAEEEANPRWITHDDGTVEDTRNDLHWQVVRSDDYPTAQTATDVCAAIPTLDGTAPWRLPTIDEARTVVVRCPNLEPGGACQLSDPDCLTKECWQSGPCECQEGRNGAGRKPFFAAPIREKAWRIHTASIYAEGTEDEGDIIIADDVLSSTIAPSAGRWTTVPSGAITCVTR